MWASIKLPCTLSIWWSGAKSGQQPSGLPSLWLTHSCPLLAVPAVILNSNLNMLLPNLWLWDMVDEFVYQFQSFCQYR